jgi:predicted kinase
MKALILLRGLPGAGKSTLAKLLSENGKYPVFSIDDYFENADGEYHFRFQENHLAYEQCRYNTEMAMKNNLQKIFIAHTFTINWEMKPYFELAEAYHYNLHIATVENHHGNKSKHAIPHEQLLKMAAKYSVKLM